MVEVINPEAITEGEIGILVRWWLT